MSQVQPKPKPAPEPQSVKAEAEVTPLAAVPNDSNVQHVESGAAGHEMTPAEFEKLTGEIQSLEDKISEQRSFIATEQAMIAEETRDEADEIKTLEAKIATLKLEAQQKAAPRNAKIAVFVSKISALNTEATPLRQRGNGYAARAKARLMEQVNKFDMFLPKAAVSLLQTSATPSGGTGTGQRHGKGCGGTNAKGNCQKCNASK